MSRGAPERPERIPCIVPWCCRTVASKNLPAAHCESICGRHWRLVDPRVKWILRRIRAKARKIGWTPTLQLLEHRNWIRAKRQAIERAMGITA